MYGDYPNLDQVKKILVIKLRHHGDVLLTSPVFTLLKKAIPHAEIDACVYQDTLPMLEGHPAISSYLTYNRDWKKLPFFKKIGVEYSFLKTIRKGGYDLILNLTEGDRGAIAALISRARYRVSFDPGKKGLKGKRSFYTHLGKNCTTPRHTVEKQLDLLRRVGIFPAPEERDVSLHIPEKAYEELSTIAGLEDYVVIHPVSRWRFKCVPPKKIAELIQALCSRGIPVVLSSGPDPQELAMTQEILSLCPTAPVYDLSGKMSLKGLAALIQNSRALICVDSVPLHIASATKTPVVALFGPSSDQNWGPWMHPHARVVAQQFSCRPCFMDGCGGSKMSDCLFTLPVSKILEAFDQVTPSSGLEISLEERSLPLKSDKKPRHS